MLFWHGISSGRYIALHQQIAQDGANVDRSLWTSGAREGGDSLSAAHHQLGTVLILLICMQIISQPEEFPEAAAACQRLRNEYVVCVEGTVRLRKDPNPRIPSGKLELAASAVTVLNAVSQKLPFLPGDDALPREETRLRNRVIDLR